MDTNFTEKPNKDSNDILLDNDFSTKVENEYLSEMFSWIVKGSKAYFLDPKIEMTTEFKERTNEILSGEDSIKTFFDRMLILTKNPKDTIKKTDLFEPYRQFCNDNSQRCQPRSSFFNRLEQIGVSKTVLHGYDVFRCVKLNLEDLEKDDEDLEKEFLNLI